MLLLSCADDLGVACLMLIYFSFHYTVTKRHYAEYVRSYQGVLQKIRRRQVRASEKYERIQLASEYNPMHDLAAPRAGTAGRRSRATGRS